MATKPSNTVLAMCKLIAYLRILPDDVWFTGKDASTITGCSVNTSYSILEGMRRYKLLSRRKRMNAHGQDIYHYRPRPPEATLL